MLNGGGLSIRGFVSTMFQLAALRVRRGAARRACSGGRRADGCAVRPNRRAPRSELPGGGRRQPVV